jgi:cytochrome c
MITPSHNARVRQLAQVFDRPLDRNGKCWWMRFPRLMVAKVEALMRIWVPTLLAAVAAVPLLAQTASTKGDATAGAKQFLQCRACHTVTKGGANSVGPNLWGVVGAKAAAKPGYAFSPAMKASGLVWDAATLDAFLARPVAKVPGNKMTFGGMPNAQARRDMIAYLATLKGK